MTIEQIKTHLQSAPDIIGKSKYRNTAVLIPLLNLSGELHFLFEKRSEGIRQGGEVSFPGGEFNRSIDSSLMETALRETYEELGLTEDKIEVIEKFGTLVAPMGLTIDVYVGLLKINYIDACNPDRSEVEGLFTIPVQYFLDNEPEIYFSKLEIHTSDIDEQGDIIELLPVARLGLPKYYSQPWTNGSYRVIVYKTSPDIIWGLTAEIVFEFCNLIKGSK